MKNEITEVSGNLEIYHLPDTREILLVNCDDGYEFLLEDYIEAGQVAKIILEILKARDNELYNTIIEEIKK